MERDDFKELCARGKWPIQGLRWTQKSRTPGSSIWSGCGRPIRSGKSLTGLVRDIAGLGWGAGKLQPNEYFLYKLYDDARFTPDVKKTFLGADRLAQLLYALDMPWPEIAHDKPTLTALLRGHDLPTPETQAMRHANRTFPGAKSLRNKSDVEQFLRKEAKYPIFTKPTDKMCSLGVANIERFDATSDSLVTSSGRQVPIAEFANQVEQYAEGGYLFQTRLNSASEDRKDRRAADELRADVRAGR